MAINKFESDTDAEVRMIQEASQIRRPGGPSPRCGQSAAPAAELGEEVLRILEEGAKHFRFA